LGEKGSEKRSSTTAKGWEQIEKEKEKVKGKTKRRLLAVMRVARAVIRRGGMAGKDAVRRTQTPLMLYHAQWPHWGTQGTGKKGRGEGV